MSKRLVRFLVFVALLVGCSSKSAHVDAPHETASASAAPSVSAAPVASASATAAPPVATAAWHPLLWRVAGNKPSYLFGTIHVPDPRLANFPPELKKALGDSDEVVNEMPLDASSMLALVGAIQLPQGKSLATELPPALYTRLKTLFDQQGLGAKFPLLEHIKVWAIAAQVALLDHQSEMAAGKGIDMILHDDGKAAGKATSGIETAAEQLAVFDGLSKDEQARMLEQTLDQRDKDRQEGKDPVTRLMNLYVSGDEAPLLAELDAGFDSKRPLDVKLFKRLITDRNKRMADRIAVLVKTHPGRAYFVAVGAAHLLGDDGVVAQLKKKGLSVERVTAP